MTLFTEKSTAGNLSHCDTLCGDDEEFQRPSLGSAAFELEEVASRQGPQAGMILLQTTHRMGPRSRSMQTHAETVSGSHVGSGERPAARVCWLRLRRPCLGPAAWDPGSRGASCAHAFRPSICTSSLGGIKELLKKKKCPTENFLAVQWLGLHASSAGGIGSIPGRGSKILHAAWFGQKKKKKDLLKGRFTTN